MHTKIHIPYTHAQTRVQNSNKHTHKKVHTIPHTNSHTHKQAQTPSDTSVSTKIFFFFSFFLRSSLSCISLLPSFPIPLFLSRFRFIFLFSSMFLVYPFDLFSRVFHFPSLLYHLPLLLAAFYFISPFVSLHAFSSLIIFFLLFYQHFFIPTELHRHNKKIFVSIVIIFLYFSIQEKLVKTNPFFCFVLFFCEMITVSFISDFCFFLRYEKNRNMT